MPTGKANAPRPPVVHTFDEAFAEHRLTPDERTAMVWHLAAIRMRQLIETLGPEPKPDMSMLRDINQQDVRAACPDCGEAMDGLHKGTCSWWNTKQADKP